MVKIEKNKIIGAVAFVAVLAVIGILAVSYTITPAFASTQKNVTEKINVSCTTAIAVPDDTIDMGTGYIPQSCIDCWIGGTQNTSICNGTAAYNVTNGTAVVRSEDFNDSCWAGTPTLPDFIKIENKGNDFVNLSIHLLNDSGWYDQSGGDEFGNNSLQVFVKTGVLMGGSYSNDNYESCAGPMLGMDNETQLNVSESVVFCQGLNFSDYANDLFLFDKFFINPKTTPKQYVFTKQITAVPSNCGDTPSTTSTLSSLTSSTTATGTYVKLDSAKGSVIGTTMDTNLPGNNSYSITADVNIFDVITTTAGTYAASSTITGSQYTVSTGLWSAVTFNLAGMATVDAANFDASPGLGGTGVALYNNAGSVMVTENRNTASTPGEFYITSTGGPTTWNTFTNPAGTFYTITGESTGAAAYFSSPGNAFVATNGPAYQHLFYIVYNNKVVSAPKLHTIGQNSAGTWVNADTTPVSFRTSADTVYGVAYNHHSGELLAAVDIGTQGTTDALDRYIVLRNGNDDPAASLVSLGSFPGISAFFGGGTFASGVGWLNPANPYDGFNANS